MSVGPAYIFLMMSNDASFVAESAIGSCAANAATIMFLAVYAKLAARGQGLGALVKAIVFWLILASLIYAMRPTPLAALLFNAAAFGVGFWLTRKILRRETAAAPIVRSRFDLPFRAAIVAAFVALIVSLSKVLGPSATGTLAAFPIVFTVVIAVLRRRIGNHACAALAAMALKAMGGFSLMLFVFAQALGPFGGAAALTLALLTTLSWSAGLVFLDMWRRRSART